MVADNINHTGAALQMNTGEQALFAAQSRLMGDLWTGKRERESTGFRRDRSKPAISRRATLELEFFARHLSRTWIQDFQPTDS